MFFPYSDLYMSEATLITLIFTLKCASLTTIIVMVPGTILAYLLARFKFPGKTIISTLVSLPLVLPPTAIGYLLLSLFATNGLLGANQIGLDLDIVLTWKAVVVACSVMSIPLVVRTARVAFEAVDPNLEAMARTLGRGPVSVFCLYTLPLASKGLLAAMILGFSRALGEFGATVTLAGNIPGKTQTISSAIFTAQQVGNEREAIFLLFVALSVGFAAIFISELLSRERPGFLSTR